jgi:hypothetical protein
VLQTSQVLFRRLCVSLVVVLPFKDSQGGTWLLNLFDFNSMGFAPQQKFGPAISEAAKLRCAYGQRNQAAGYLSLV